MHKKATETGTLERIERYLLDNKAFTNSEGIGLVTIRHDLSLIGWSLYELHNMLEKHAGSNCLGWNQSNKRDSTSIRIWWEHPDQE